MKYLSPAEIEARKPLWLALSDLYLDTDTRLSYAYIARVMAQSSFTLDEIHGILLEEVAPVVADNLLQVAGDWAGFPEEWLFTRILARQGERKPVWPPVDIDSDWQCVAKLAAILRTLPDDDARERRWRLWDALILLFLDKRPLTRRTMPDDPDLQDIFHGELWPILIGDVRRFHKMDPKHHPSEADVEANWRDFVTNRERS